MFSKFSFCSITLQKSITFIILTGLVISMWNHPKIWRCFPFLAKKKGWVRKANGVSQFQYSIILLLFIFMVLWLLSSTSSLNASQNMGKLASFHVKLMDSKKKYILIFSEHFPIEICISCNIQSYFIVLDIRRFHRFL